MTGSLFYDTGSGDPDGPRLLAEYCGPQGRLRPGDQVVYDNPEASWLPDLGTLTVTEIVDLGAGMVTMILNDGKWECGAHNLRPADHG